MIRIAWLSTAALIAWIAAISLSAVQVTAQDRVVTLTGCLMTGEGDDGYVLTNASGDTARASGDVVAPGPVGTSGGAAMTLYWLEDDDALEDHVGHRVEVVGELAGDIEAGEIEIEREGDWTELRIRSDGDDLTVRIPQSIVVLSSRSDDDKSLDVLVRKVDVERVRMLGASCS